MQTLPSAEAVITGSPPASAAPFAREFVTLSRQEHIELVWQGQYWKTQHPQAVQRIERLQCEHRRQLHDQAEQAAQREQALRRDLERAQGRVKELEHRLFAHKRTLCGSRGSTAAERRAGAQARSAAWTRGHGRRSFSEVLEVEVKAYRRVIRRRRYRPVCQCEHLPGIVSAAPPARLIERGKLGVSVWVEALLDKFEYGRASHRWMNEMADLGARISPGTLCGGLQAITSLFVPVYQAFLPRLREGVHWHIDETRWEVSVEREGKSGHRWWLWVFQSAHVTY